MYFYRGHLHEKVYTSETELTDDELRCGICGEYDDYLGEYATVEEFEKDYFEKDYPD